MQENKQNGTTEIEQLALIDEPEFEGDLLLPREEMEKRYTGENGKKALALWESKRNHILDLMGCGWPLEEIAKHTKASTRLIKALGAQFAATVNQSGKTMAKVLGTLAMKAAFHIDQKMDEAKAGELGVIMGIALQRKQELEMASMSEPNENAIDATVEDAKAVEARAWLLKRQEEKALTRIAPIDANEKTEAILA